MQNAIEQPFIYGISPCDTQPSERKFCVWAHCKNGNSIAEKVRQRKSTQLHTMWIFFVVVEIVQRWCIFEWSLHIDCIEWFVRWASETMHRASTLQQPKQWTLQSWRAERMGNGRLYEHCTRKSMLCQLIQLHYDGVRVCVCVWVCACVHNRLDTFIGPLLHSK